MSVKRVIVPYFFGWLLLIQAPIAAVAIYASVFIFGGKTVPFVLAVVATILHLLLGIYCYVTRSKPGSYHVFVILAWLAACIGLWCGPLSYFARLIANYRESEWLAEGTSQHQASTWTKAGCAVSALSIFIDIMLAAFFLLAVRRQQTQEPEEEYFTSRSLEAPPQLPPFTPIHHHRISLPYPPPTATPPNRNPHLSPTIIPVAPERQPQRPQRQQPPSPRETHQNQRQQPHQPHRHHHHHHHQPSLSSKPLPALPPLPLPPLTLSPTTPPNRIALILHLTHLQNPRTGHWPPSPELTTLLHAWTGGRGAVAPGGRGATALAHACLTELCGRVWAAQREGREGEVLSAEELRVLEGVGWDLRWVEGRIGRAGGWLERGGDV
ncbi:uncharacterized protein B0H64DRAFT_467119 [Chaetomium fimeti]|uniref:Uncharacterized protein n=1 Tax=Chaetomium fimeti TaxID=1854472 RepID=A0AAE0LP56_9PEZI|nr:hypothetical protein B0H64DRAFT_467119 [Chaetomium fimeti]